AGGPVAADADAEDPRPAAFALCLQDRVKNRLAAAVQVAAGLELFVGQRILPPNISAPPAFEHEPHVDVGRAVLVEMDGGRTGPHIGAVVLAGDGVHGVLPEETLLGGQL